MICFRTAWDDDDANYRKKTEWDYPTPKIHDYRDETPRPTPAYKYNKWAPDRRKTGATPITGRSNLFMKYLLALKIFH